jgi:hypothetical protein
MIYIATSKLNKSSKAFQRLWAMDGESTRRITTLAFPIGLTIVAESGMFIAIGLMISLFGTLGIAASAIANQITAFYGTNCTWSGRHDPCRPLCRQTGQAKPETKRSLGNTGWHTCDLSHDGGSADLV